jgi:hypothetical protein
LLFWRATDCTTDDAHARESRSAHYVGFVELVVRRSVEVRKKSLSLRRGDAVGVHRWQRCLGTLNRRKPLWIPGHGVLSIGSVGCDVCLLVALVRRTWFDGLEHRSPRCGSSGEVHANATAAPSLRRKPEWVLREVIGLKAIFPEASVRDIAGLFNQRHVPLMTVKKVMGGLPAARACARRRGTPARTAPSEAVGCCDQRRVGR